MNIKKMLAATMTGAMLLMTMPIIATDFNVKTVEAAKGGAKIGGIKSAPKVNLNKTPAAKAPAASESKSVSGAGKTYTPSKNAKDLPNNNPATKSNSAAANQTNSSTGFGNTLRNIGLFAGGMMLGGLLGSMLGGFGGGFLSDIFGLLFNIIMLYALYRGGRYLWNRFRGNQNEKTVNFKHNNQPIDITPPQAINYNSSVGTDYNPKRTADYYRNL